IYNISLDVAGVGNRTTSIIYFIQVTYGSNIEMTENVHISFETEILPAGTYTISLFWKSTHTVIGGTTNLVAIGDYPRSLYVQEIAG
ncbi:MAG: hypothetical protein ACTSRK_13985, partial [Promethearchaeota archaeon]